MLAFLNTLLATFLRRVSLTLNQTQVMMAVPAWEDLWSERGVTALKDSVPRAAVVTA